MKKLKNMFNKKGFTLIELIVVIAILGILAAIVAPQFSGFQKDAREKADAETAAIIEKSILVAIANDDLVVLKTGDIVILESKTAGVNFEASATKGAFSYSEKSANTSHTLEEVLAKYIATKVTAQGVDDGTARTGYTIHIELDGKMTSTPGAPTAIPQ